MKKFPTIPPVALGHALFSQICGFAFLLATVGISFWGATCEGSLCESPCVVLVMEFAQISDRCLHSWQVKSSHTSMRCGGDSSQRAATCEHRLKQASSSLSVSCSSRPAFSHFVIIGHRSRWQQTARCNLYVHGTVC